MTALGSGWFSGITKVDIFGAMVRLLTVLNRLTGSITKSVTEVIFSVLRSQEMVGILRNVARKTVISSVKDQKVGAVEKGLIELIMIK